MLPSALALRVRSVLRFSLPLLIGLAGRAAAAERPNLLVLITDEHNFRTLGCYRERMTPEQAFMWGPEVKVDTPNLDWIARHGAIADRYYATSPVCTPSRASLMSGLYPQNTGAPSNNQPLRDEIVTYAEVLRRQGYATGYAGKWHVDGDARPGWAPARKFGFEDNRYMFNRGHYKNLQLTADGARVGATGGNGEPNYNLAGADEKTFTTDFLADRAVEFIQANRERSFCYTVSFPDPHGPNTVRAPYDTMFAPAKFRQPHSATQPGRNLPNYASVIAERFNQQEMARYFGMVKCIDDNVGKILDALRAAGVLERTFIVVTSDHGDMCGEHGRHNKGIPLEASARVPFLVHAPGVVPAGTHVKAALANVSFKPTILALMGIVDQGRTEGRDASAFFRGASSEGDAADEIAFLRIGAGEEGGQGWMAALNRRHKFVVGLSGEIALFDLETDPDELINLAGSVEHRSIVRSLAQALHGYAEAHRDPHGSVATARRALEWAMGSGMDYRPPPSAEKTAAPGKKKKKAK